MSRLRPVVRSANGHRPAGLGVLYALFRCINSLWDTYSLRFEQNGVEVPSDVNRPRQALLRCSNADGRALGAREVFIEARLRRSRGPRCGRAPPTRPVDARRWSKRVENGKYYAAAVRTNRRQRRAPRCLRERDAPYANSVQAGAEPSSRLV